MFKEELRLAAEAAGIEMTEEQLSAFETYFNMLIEWNEKMNLTAITDPKEAAVKHMLDSLSAWDNELFTEDMSLIDVGTGAGFPGIPLKIMHPGIKLTLLDSLKKRVGFLQAVTDALGLQDVQCIHGRAEESARQKGLRESFDGAVSRAVARMSIVSEYCIPFVKKGGVFAAMKGMKYGEENQEAQNAYRVLGAKELKVKPVKLPGLEDVRAVIYVKKTLETPKTYPRKAGTPEKRPL